MRGIRGPGPSPRLLQRLFTSTQTQRDLPAFDTIDEAVSAVGRS